MIKLPTYWFITELLFIELTEHRYRYSEIYLIELYDDWVINASKLKWYYYRR